MNNVVCPNCGKAVPENRSHCPLCGSPINKHSQTVNARSQKRFIIWFIFLVIFCFFFALWLPR